MRMIRGESIVASYTKLRTLDVLFGLIIGSGILCFTAFIQADAGSGPSSYSITFGIIAAAFTVIWTACRSRRAIFITPTALIYRPALGRLELAPFQHIVKMWKTKSTIPVIPQRGNATAGWVDALAVHMADGKIFVWPLVFPNKDELLRHIRMSSGAPLVDRPRMAGWWA